MQLKLNVSENTPLWIIQTQFQNVIPKILVGVCISWPSSSSFLKTMINIFQNLVNPSNRYCVDNIFTANSLVVDFRNKSTIFSSLYAKSNMICCWYLHMFNIHLCDCVVAVSLHKNAKTINLMHLACDALLWRCLSKF